MGIAQKSLLGVGAAALGAASAVGKAVSGLSLEAEQAKLKELQGVRAAKHNLVENQELNATIKAQGEEISGLEEAAQAQDEAIKSAESYKDSLVKDKQGKVRDPKTNKFVSESKLNAKIEEMKKSFESANQELEARKAQRAEFEDRLKLVKEEGELINQYYKRNDAHVKEGNK